MPAPFLPPPGPPRPWWANPDPGPTTSGMGPPGLPVVFLPEPDGADVEGDGDDQPDDRPPETLLVAGPLDEGRAATVVASILAGARRRRALRLVLNSEGGPLPAALAILDVMGSAGGTVSVSILGRASGTAGLVAALCPGTRRMGPSATIDLHLPDGSDAGFGAGFGVGFGVGLTADSMARRADAHTRLVRDLADRLAARCGGTLAAAEALLRDPAPLDRTQAVARGLVDDDPD